LSRKTIDDIAVLGESKADVQHSTIAAPKAILGELSVTDALHFTSADSGFIAGIWESTPGKFHAVYEEDEFYYMLEGKVVIADDQGNARTFTPGDCIVVPAGFVGTWDVLENTKKFYAHHRPAAGS
jgi:uncharacterized cupin superfamily protein